MAESSVVHIPCDVYIKEETILDPPGQLESSAYATPSSDWGKEPKNGVRGAIEASTQDPSPLKREPSPIITRTCPACHKTFSYRSQLIAHRLTCSKRKTDAGKKKVNFTPQEKFLLMKLVGKNQHILENKRSDSTTVLLKKRKWEELAQEFNRISHECQRNHEQLKKCYENIKSQKKKGLSMGGYYEAPLSPYDFLAKAMDLELANVSDGNHVPFVCQKGDASNYYLDDDFSDPLAQSVNHSVLDEEASEKLLRQEWTSSMERREVELHLLRKKALEADLERVSLEAARARVLLLNAEEQLAHDRAMRAKQLL